MLGALTLGPAEKVMQAAHSTCRCSLEEGPQSDVWISYHLSRMLKLLEMGFSSSDLPSLGLVAVHFAPLQTIDRTFDLQLQILWKVRRFCAAETVVLPQVAHSTCLCSVKFPRHKCRQGISRLTWRRAPCRKFWVSGEKKVVDNWMSGRSLHCLAWRSSRMQRFFMKTAQQVQRV